MDHPNPMIRSHFEPIMEKKPPLVYSHVVIMAEWASCRTRVQKVHPEWVSRKSVQ